MKRTIFTGLLVWIILVFPDSSRAQTMNEQDFLGAWQCDSLIHGSALKQGEFAEGWKVADGGLTVSLHSRLTFENGNGSFTVTSSAPNPVDMYSSEPFQSPYTVKNGQLLAFTYFQGGTNYFYEIRKLSETQISLYPVAGGLFPVLMCDRANAAVSITSSATPLTQNTRDKQSKGKL